MKKAVIHKVYRANRKINLSVLCKPLIFAAVLQSLSGCVKDDLYNTPHPDKGAVVVTTTWDVPASRADFPGVYRIRINETNVQAGERTFCFPELQDPGSSRLTAYTEPEGLTVTGYMAAADELPDGSLALMDEDFHSGMQDIAVVADDTLRVNLHVTQRTHRLVLVLKLKGDDGSLVTSTHATLTGIASAMDITTGAITSTAGKEIHPRFVQTGNTLQAVMTLMGGVAGEAQKFSVTFSMTNGQDYTVENDLTEAFKDFAASGEPLTLNADVQFEAQGDFQFGITDWIEGGHESGDVN